MATPEQTPEVSSRTVAIRYADPRNLPNAAKFQTSGITLHPTEEIASLPALMKQAKIEAVVIEFQERPSPAELQIVRGLRSAYPKLPLIVAVPAGDHSLRLEATRSGATDVLAAPLRSEVLLAALIRRLFPERAGAGRSTRGSLGPLIGNSEPMQHLYDAILRVARTNSTIMIRGESGTGKELVARTIVTLSARRDKPFIPLNCAALPETLMESELFGSEKGAYTGATVSRPGHIEQAHEGTLFLDEIATLPLALQTKLLRVIQDRAVQRLGSSVSKTSDFRLLTATNEDLEELVKAGRFREDLYYRINVIPIDIPPLRERGGDIAILAKHYLALYCAAHGVPAKRLELATLEVLEENPWAGNVRQLENLMQRLVLMVEGDTIGVHHLPEQILYESATQHEALLIPEEGIDFDQEMERIEVAYIRAALRRCGGRKTSAAALLRVNEQRMKYLCRKYRIKLGDESAGEAS